MTANNIRYSLMSLIIDAYLSMIKASGIETFANVERFQAVDYPNKHQINNS